MLRALTANLPLQFLHASDCAENAWAADIFFPVVLLLSNYVMLNLFVGMIMNNFAYISCKDGNGAVEDEHFIDAAFKYAQKLDPKRKGQIPLEQVVIFRNHAMIFCCFKGSRISLVGFFSDIVP